MDLLASAAVAQERTSLEVLRKAFEEYYGSSAIFKQRELLQFSCKLSSLGAYSERTLRDKSDLQLRAAGLPLELVRIVRRMVGNPQISKSMLPFQSRIYDQIGTSNERLCNTSTSPFGSSLSPHHMQLQKLQRQVRLQVQAQVGRGETRKQNTEQRQTFHEWLAFRKGQVGKVPGESMMQREDKVIMERKQTLANLFKTKHQDTEEKKKTNLPFSGQLVSQGQKRGRLPSLADRAQSKVRVESSFSSCAFPKRVLHEHHSPITAAW